MLTNVGVETGNVVAADLTLMGERGWGEERFWGDYKVLGVVKGF